MEREDGINLNTVKEKIQRNFSRYVDYYQESVDYMQKGIAAEQNIRKLSSETVNRFENLFRR